jgi:ABC-type anion transport system duplicated permease subunit
MEIKSGFVVLFGISFIIKIILHYWIDKLENGEKPSISNLLLENFVSGFKLKILLPFYFKLNSKGNENKEIKTLNFFLMFSIFLMYFSLIIGLFYLY